MEFDIAYLMPEMAPTGETAGYVDVRDGTRYTTAEIHRYRTTGAAPRVRRGTVGSDVPRAANGAALPLQSYPPAQVFAQLLGVAAGVGFFALLAPMLLR